ncbi:DinB family protein, partial [bacterium]|nr:DinB family protein [bacterium]
TLEDPTVAWPPIDPPARVVERGYNAREPVEALAGFRTERAGSLVWLAGLDAGALDLAYRHPKLGDLRAGDLLAAWAAHDLLHLRQLANTLLDVLGEDAAPFSTRYAMP